MLFCIVPALFATSNQHPLFFLRNNTHTMGACALTIPGGVEEEEVQEVEMTPQQKNLKIAYEAMRSAQQIRKEALRRAKSALTYAEKNTNGNRSKILLTMAKNAVAHYKWAKLHEEEIKGIVAQQPTNPA